ncbi:hypothetical protein GCM10027280_16290 [Micromonospora polyrhachis]|uniref:HSP20 family protein n=1 Tax=Micromonospora polyrhachis TaxID=1282883 RepID=A0A7W7SPD3_9ACTN|nr:Hsp20/alpha crystallin family protein [Micromonospora polyrhachis]MBB4958483.1 HSP20 family protein [Micromonospora polyrhachis]
MTEHGEQQEKQRPAERRWDPVADLQTLRSGLGRMVGSALASIGGGSPDVELCKTETGWAVVARLPGVAPEEVALELDERELCIRARSEEEVNADHGMAGTGSRTRGFEYRINLPAQADLDNIDAVMDHGLLTVMLPQAARTAPRTITVGRRLYPEPGAGTPQGGLTRPIAGDPAADRELHRPEAGAPGTARWQHP